MREERRFVRCRRKLEGCRERVGDININIIIVVIVCGGKEGGEGAWAVEPRQAPLRG